MANSVERALGFSEGPYFLRDFGTADVIMAPYLERILASLFYYKGYDLRREHPKIDRCLVRRHGNKQESATNALQRHDERF